MKHLENGWTDFHEICMITIQLKATQNSYLLISNNHWYQRDGRSNLWGGKVMLSGDGITHDTLRPWLRHYSWWRHCASWLLQQLRNKHYYSCWFPWLPSHEHRSSSISPDKNKIVESAINATLCVHFLTCFLQNTSVISPVCPPNCWTFRLLKH
jgi:hypothetical protein